MRVLCLTLTVSALENQAMRDASTLATIPQSYQSQTIIFQIFPHRPIPSADKQTNEQLTVQMFEFVV